MPSSLSSSYLLRSLVGISMQAVTSCGGLLPVGMSCHGWIERVGWRISAPGRVGDKPRGCPRRRQRPAALGAGEGRRVPIRDMPVGRLEMRRRGAALLQFRHLLREEEHVARTLAQEVEIPVLIGTGGVPPRPPALLGDP